MTTVMERTRDATLPAPKTMSRLQLIHKVILELEKQAGEFRPLYVIDDISEAEIRAMTTENTAAAAVENVLKELGIATDGTVGSTMDPLGMDKDDAHYLYCSCLGEKVTGTVLMERLAFLHSAKALQLA